MPSHQRPKYDWPVSLRLDSPKKPRLVDWPGLDTLGMLTFRYPNGRKGWRFCLNGLLAN